MVDENGFFRYNQRICLRPKDEKTESEGQVMTSKSIAKLLIAVLLIAGIVYVAMFGLTIGGKVLLPATFDEEYGVRKGLDLTGGSVLVFEADGDAEITASNMDQTVSILQGRADRLGLAEAVISPQGTNRIRVEIPSVSDPTEARDMLGALAQLSFRKPDGTVVLTGDDIKSAESIYSAVDETGIAKYHVALTLTEEGSEKFYAATSEVAAAAEDQRYIAIYLDESFVSAPSVSQAINTTECVITVEQNDDAREYTEYLATTINDGKLPFKLNAIEMRTVGATLGEGALSSSLLAALIGIIIILIFMLLYYRLPGLMADLALIAYVGIVCIVLAKFRVNLSLPGIAGVILSIGMAVDANVVIFERIKEELRMGKSSGAAIDAGFHRALTAIIDSNITTLIAAVVLYVGGTGSIRGFAVTLGLGVLISMLTAIFVTRFLIRQMIGLKVKNPKFYGI